MPKTISPYSPDHFDSLNPTKPSGYKKKYYYSPERIILFSIVLTIAIGTFLLSFPMCQKIPFSLLDLLFTATSATCVTGLLTVPLDQFTIYGKCIILCLIQIGGIGLITMTLCAVSLFVDFGLTTQLMAGKILEFDSWHHIKKFLIFIIVFTVIIECMGTLLLLPFFYNQYQFSYALFFALFHSVSFFCNAGFMLFDSITHPLFLSITAFLVLCGGIGFITWHEIMRYIQARREKKRYTFSLHTKIVFYSTVSTVAFFALSYWFLEYSHTLSHMPLQQSIGYSLYQAIVLRSVGFSVIPISFFHSATLLIMMTLAFMGSAPGSTGSGVKVTAFAIFFATVKAAITGRNAVELRGRTFAKDQIYKAIAIIFVSFASILAATFCLLISEHHAEFLTILLEVIAASTNLGVSLGLTPSLTSFGKCCIMLCMIGGRIGILTILLALRSKRQENKSGLSYPEERVMLS